MAVDLKREEGLLKMLFTPIQVEVSLGPELDSRVGSRHLAGSPDRGDRSAPRSHPGAVQRAAPAT